MGPALKAIKGRQRTFAVKYATRRANGDRFTQDEPAIAAGYSKKNANQSASQLLKNPKVLAAVREVEDEIYSKDIMSAQEAQQRLSRMGRFDPKQFIKEDGQVDIEALKESDIIADSIEVETRIVGECEEVQKIKVKGNAKAAIDSLSRIKGYNAKEEIEVTHKTGVMVVPMADSVDGWEQAAAKSQQELMDDANNV